MLLGVLYNLSSSVTLWGEVGPQHGQGRVCGGLQGQQCCCRAQTSSLGRGGDVGQGCLGLMVLKVLPQTNGPMTGGVQRDPSTGDGGGQGHAHVSPGVPGEQLEGTAETNPSTSQSCPTTSSCPTNTRAVPIPNTHRCCPVPRLGAPQPWPSPSGAWLPWHFHLRGTDPSTLPRPLAEHPDILGTQPQGSLVILEGTCGVHHHPQPHSKGER